MTFITKKIKINFYYPWAVKAALEENSIVDCKDSSSNAFLFNGIFINLHLLFHYFFKKTISLYTYL